MNRSSLLLGLALLGLTLIALPLCGWFSVHSTAFASYLQTSIDRHTRPGVLDFDSFEMGPGLSEITLFGVTMRGRSGQPMLVAERARVAVALTDMETGDRSLTLEVSEIEVSDFELKLAWDRFGHFNMGDPFRQRAFDIAREKKPDFKLDLHLADIQLTRGRLHLTWPTFGFIFDDISTRGSVRVRPKQLDIDVPLLESGLGTAWFAKAPDPMRESLEAILPDHELTKALPGLQLPWTDLVIQAFVWEKDGFTVDQLTIDGGEHFTVKAGGSLGFPKRPDGQEDAPKPGITHDLAFNIRAASPVVEGLSGKQASGDVTVQVTTQGQGLASKVALSNFRLARLDFGEVGLKDLDLTELTMDARKDQALLRMAMAAGEVRYGGLKMSAPAIDTQVTLGCEGWEAQKLVSGLLSPPESALGWLSVFPAATRAKLTVPSLEVGKLDYEDQQLSGVKLKDLALEGGVSEISCRFEEASATELGAATGQATASLSLGFTGQSLEASATLTLKGASLKALRDTLPDHPALEGLAGPRVNGTIVIAGDLFDPDSFEVAKVEVTDAQ